MNTQQITSILYLDDESSCLNIFRDFFGAKYDVHTAMTVDAAREALGRSAFDIVMSDQLMPEIDGLTFLRSVAATHPESYRVMLTGSIGVGQVIREVSAGIIHLFVAKPWTEADMSDALERGTIEHADFARVPRARRAKSGARNAA